MIKENVTVDDAIVLLNSMLEADPDTTAKFFDLRTRPQHEPQELEGQYFRVECNDTLANHSKTKHRNCPLLVHIYNLM